MLLALLGQAQYQTQGISQWYCQDRALTAQACPFAYGMTLPSGAVCTFVNGCTPSGGQVVDPSLSCVGAAAGSFFDALWNWLTGVACPQIAEQPGSAFPTQGTSELTGVLGFVGMTAFTIVAFEGMIIALALVGLQVSVFGSTIKLSETSVRALIMTVPFVVLFAMFYVQDVNVLAAFPMEIGLLLTVLLSFMEMVGLMGMISYG